MLMPEWFFFALLGWIGLAVITFPFLFKTVAPFGRHNPSGSGLKLPNRLGWVLMESPAVWWFPLLFFLGPVPKIPVMYCIFALWMIHYVHRTLIFPFRIRTKGKSIPISIVVSAFIFQMVNGFFNGYLLGWGENLYSEDWLSDFRFIGGLIIFLSGFVLNYWADFKLIHLRKPGETGYKIPNGGFFKWVSCPNFTGEILEWGGFALLCWNWAALSFFLWTAANLMPRAWAHHRWYKSQFPDYPVGRKAVIPWLF